MKYEMSIDGNFALNVLTTQDEYNASYERVVTYPFTWGEKYPDASWGVRYGHACIEFQGEMFLMGGRGTGTTYYNDVWSSTDGKKWTRAIEHAAWSGRYGFTLLKFNNKLWVIGGSDSTTYYNDVWFSTDGKKWKRATDNASWGSRSGHAGLVFDNKMWILGGDDDGTTYYNDVWSSTDGTVWKRSTANASWGSRSGHAGLVFDNKMWILGGDDDGTAYYNDVWSSTDGKKWTEATSSASWGERYGHAGLVFDNKMWLFGGYGNGDYYTGTWYSVNGINWIKQSVDVAFTGRDFLSGLVFDNKMWILGGDGNKGKLNDVLAFTFGYSETLYAHNSLSLLSMDTGSYAGRFSQYQSAIGGAYVVETRSALQIQDREVVMQFNILPDKPDEYISNKWFGKYLSLLKQVNSIKYNTHVDLFDMIITSKKDIYLDLKYVYHSVEWIEHNMIGVLTVVYYDTGNGWYTDLNLDNKGSLTTSNIIYDGVYYQYGVEVDDAFNKGFTSISPSFHFWLKDNTSFPDWFFIAHNNGDEIMYLDFSVLHSSYKGVPARYFYVNCRDQRVSCNIKSTPTFVRYLDDADGVFGQEQFRRLERTTNLDSKGYGFTFLCSHPNVIYEVVFEGRYYLEM